MSSEIERLEELITKKEAQLSRAESESNSLNSGKFKTSSNAEISKIYVKSLQKEVNDLYSQLEKIKHENT